MTKRLLLGLASAGILCAAVAAILVLRPSDSGDLAVIRVDMYEFSYDPERIEIPEGTKVKLEVVNRGRQTHDLKVGGKEGTGFLQAGESETVEVGPFEQSQPFWCTVGGHREAGMESVVEVLPAP